MKNLYVALVSKRNLELLVWGGGGLVNWVLYLFLEVEDVEMVTIGWLIVITPLCCDMLSSLPKGYKL